MELLKCSEKNCGQEGIYSCNCKVALKYFCLEHVEKHIENEGEHNLQQNFMRLNQKELLIVNIKKCKQECKKLKEKAVNDFRAIQEILLEQLSKALNVIREKELMFDCLIDVVESKEFIRIGENSNEDEQFVMKYAEKPFDMLKEFREFGKTLAVQVPELVKFKAQFLDKRMEKAEVKAGGMENLMDEASFRKEEAKESDRKSVRVARKVVNPVGENPQPLRKSFA